MPDERDFEDIVEDFGTTSMVAPKADESLGVWYHINRQKQQILNLREALGALNRKINGVKNAQANLLTDTGLNRKLDERQIKRMAKWWDAARGPITEMFIKWGAHILWGGILLAASHIVVKGLSKGG